MLKIYSQLFALPGAKRIAIGGFIARMPIAMDSIAIILFVHSVDKRYAIAGSITAVAALATVISTPLWAKAADVRGQLFVLKTAVPIRITAIVLFIALVKSGAPIWSWFISILIAESASISMGSLSRRRWAHLIDSENKSLLSTSYTFESLLDEFIFILGPILTTAIVVAVAPVAGLVLGILFLVIGVPLLASHSDSDPGNAEMKVERTNDSVLRNRKLQAIAIPITIAGGCFTAINICVVAFTDERNVNSQAGLLLGIWAVGGAVSALINGAITWKISHGSRYLAYLFGMTVISLTFPFIDNVYLLAVALFLQGTCIAPLLPNGLSLVTHSVPESQMTQAITLATAGIPLTGALSSFLSGRIIDSAGASAGLWLPFGFLIVASAATIPYLKEYKD